MKGLLPRLRFVPWPFKGRCDGAATTLVVDSLQRRAGDVVPGLVVSHHVWSGVPQLEEEMLCRHRVDSSADGVLAWLQDGATESTALSTVTADHYDIDSALSVWSALHPTPALTHSALISAASNIGDFRHYAHHALTSPLFDDALKLCCMLNTMERDVYSSKPFKGTDVEGAKLEGAVLCHLPDIFAGKKPRLHSTNEYRRVRRELSRGHEVVVHSDVDVAVVVQERPGHYYALFAGTEECDVVVAVYSGQRYEVEQKYTSYVRTHRKTLPRVSMHALARALQKAESESFCERYVWSADNVLDTGPLLRVYERGVPVLPKHMRYGAPKDRAHHKSSLSNEVFVAIVLAHFRERLVGAVPKHVHTRKEVADFNRALSE